RLSCEERELNDHLSKFESTEGVKPVEYHRNKVQEYSPKCTYSKIVKSLLKSTLTENPLNKLYDF
ncbi:hypothetical protein L9F63_024964, partial [Diploptera punctata]